MMLVAVQLPLLADVFRAAAVLACWPRCFDASVEAYASRDPTRRSPPRTHFALIEGASDRCTASASVTPRRTNTDSRDPAHSA
jgi:hypothetical protein